jgi:hypothetical protein
MARCLDSEHDQFVILLEPSVKEKLTWRELNWHDGWTRDLDKTRFEFLFFLLQNDIVLFFLKKIEGLL